MKPHDTTLCQLLLLLFVPFFSLVFSDTTCPPFLPILENLTIRRPDMKNIKVMQEPLATTPMPVGTTLLLTCQQNTYPIATETMQPSDLAGEFYMTNHLESSSAATTCTASGYWTSFSLACKKACDNLVTLDDEELDSSYLLSGVGTVHGSERTVTCDTGYYPSYFGHAQKEDFIYCVDGEWTRPNFLCLPACDLDYLEKKYSEEVYRLDPSEDGRSVSVSCVNDLARFETFWDSSGDLQQRVVTGNAPEVLTCVGGRWPSLSFTCAKVCPLVDVNDNWRKRAFTLANEEIPYSLREPTFRESVALPGQVFDSFQLPQEFVMEILLQTEKEKQQEGVLDSSSGGEKNDTQEVDTNEAATKVAEESTGENMAAAEGSAVVGEEGDSAPGEGITSAMLKEKEASTDAGVVGTDIVGEVMPSQKTVAGSPGEDEGQAEVQEEGSEAEEKNAVEVTSKDKAEEEEEAKSDKDNLQNDNEETRRLTEKSSTAFIQVNARADPSLYYGDGSSVKMTCAKGLFTTNQETEYEKVGCNSGHWSPSLMTCERPCLPQKLTRSDVILSQSSQAPSSLYYSGTIQHLKCNAGFSLPSIYYLESLSVSSSVSLLGRGEESSEGQGDALTAISQGNRVRAALQTKCLDGEWTSPSATCFATCGLPLNKVLAKNVQLNLPHSLLTQKEFPSGYRVGLYCSAGRSSLPLKSRGYGFLTQIKEEKKGGQISSSHLEPQNEPNTTCQEGEWTPPNVRCAKKCDEFVINSPNVLVKGTDTYTGAWRELSCKKGYGPVFPLPLNHFETVFCYEGVWEIPRIRCEPLCEHPREFFDTYPFIAEEQKFHIKSYYQVGEKISFQCPHGSKRGDLQCSPKGLWVVSKNPHCINACPKLQLDKVNSTLYRRLHLLVKAETSPSLQSFNTNNLPDRIDLSPGNKAKSTFLSLQSRVRSHEAQGIEGSEDTNETASEVEGGEVQSATVEEYAEEGGDVEASEYLPEGEEEIMPDEHDGGIDNGSAQEKENAMTDSNDSIVDEKDIQEGVANEGDTQKGDMQDDNAQESDKKEVDTQTSGAEENQEGEGETGVTSENVPEGEEPQLPIAVQQDEEGSAQKIEEETPKENANDLGTERPAEKDSLPLEGEHIDLQAEAVESETPLEAPTSKFTPSIKEEEEVGAYQWAQVKTGDNLLTIGGSRRFAQCMKNHTTMPLRWPRTFKTEEEAATFQRVLQLFWNPYHEFLSLLSSASSPTSSSLSSSVSSTTNSLFHERDRMGAEQLICSSSGEWSLPSVTCVPSCSPFQIPSQGYEVEHSTSLTYGTQIQVKCARGFTPDAWEGTSEQNTAQKSSSQTVTCINGHWTPLTLECFRPCSAIENSLPQSLNRYFLRHSSGGDGDVWSDWTKGGSPITRSDSGTAESAELANREMNLHGALVQLKCASPYAIVEDSTSEVDELVCRDGEWSPVRLRCELTCSTPPQEKNDERGLVIRLDSGEGSIHHGAIREVQCAPGMMPILSGKNISSEKEYTKNLRYSGSFSHYSPLSTSSLVSSSTGDSAEQSTDAIETIVCLFGKWSAPVSICEPACPSLEYLTKVEIEGEPVYDITVLGDATGWTMEEEIKRSMSSTEEPDVKELQNQVLLSLSTRIRPYVHVQCLPPFSSYPPELFPSGDQILTCSNGQWTRLVLQCLKQCAPPPSDIFEATGVAVSVFDDGYGDVSLRSLREQTMNNLAIYLPKDVTQSSGDNTISSLPPLPSQSPDQMIRSSYLHGFSFLLTCQSGYSPMVATRPTGMIQCAYGQWQILTLQCIKVCSDSSSPPPQETTDDTKKSDDDKTKKEDEEGENKSPPESVFVIEQVASSQTRELTCEEGYFPDQFLFSSPLPLGKLATREDFFIEEQSCQNGEWTPYPRFRCLPGCPEYSLPIPQYRIYRRQSGKLISLTPSSDTTTSPLEGGKKEEKRVVPQGTQRVIQCGDGYIPKRGYNGERTMCYDGLWTEILLVCERAVVTTWTTRYERIWSSQWIAGKKILSGLNNASILNSGLVLSAPAKFLSPSVSDSRSKRFLSKISFHQHHAYAVDANGNVINAYDNEITIWRPYPYGGFSPIGDLITFGDAVPIFPSVLYAGDVKRVSDADLSSNYSEEEHEDMKKQWQLQSLSYNAKNYQCTGDVLKTSLSYSPSPICLPKDCLDDIQTPRKQISLLWGGEGEVSPLSPSSTTSSSGFDLGAALTHDNDEMIASGVLQSSRQALPLQFYQIDPLNPFSLVARKEEPIETAVDGSFAFSRPNDTCIQYCPLIDPTVFGEATPLQNAYRSLSSLPADLLPSQDQMCNITQLRVNLQKDYEQARQAEV